MELNLKRPLVFLDLETTGTDIASDRIVEIAMLKIDPNGREFTYEKRVNPTIPIPPQVSEIHGITNEDVVTCPLFKEIAREVANFLKGTDIAGYNICKFDIPLLAEELLRAQIDFDLRQCNYVDVQNIFHQMEKRTLSAAYKFYCNQEHTGAHSALGDSRATYQILKAQLDRYQNIPYEDEKGVKSFEVVNDINTLSKFSYKTEHVDYAGRIIYDENNIPVFNFGKHKGVSVAKVFEKDPGYYSWVLSSNFPEFTKKVLTEIRLGILKK